MQQGNTGNRSERRGHRPERIGIVVSDRMDKTAVVKVERRFAHPVYKKFVRRTTQYIVHNERNEAKVGDRVRIVESRPISRRKHWRIQEILERAVGTARAGGEETAG